MELEEDDELVRAALEAVGFDDLGENDDDEALIAEALGEPLASKPNPPADPVTTPPPPVLPAPAPHSSHSAQPPSPRDPYDGADFESDEDNDDIDGIDLDGVESIGSDELDGDYSLPARRDMKGVKGGAEGKAELKVAEVGGEAGAGAGPGERPESPEIDSLGLLLDPRVGQFQGCQALCSARVGKDVVALGCLGGLIVGVSLGVSVAATCTTSSSEVWRLQLPASADLLSLCASDSHLVAGSKDGTVTCMPLPASGAKAPQPLHKGAALHRGAVWDIAVDGSGKKFVTAGDDQVLLVVDAGDAGGKVLDKLVGHHAPVMCVAASPERIVSGDSDGVVHVWAWDTGLIKNSLKGHAARACGVARLPGGGTATCSQDGTLRVWSPAGVEERRAEGLGKPARMVGEPSTGLLAVVVGRHALVYAPTSAMCPVASFALPHPAAHLHFSARDQLVATGPFGMVAWSLAIVDLAHMCSMPSHDDDVTSVAMLGTVAVSGGKDSRVHVWDLEAVESERVLEADSEVWSVVLSRDGALTAAACEDGSVLLWSTRTGARLSTVPHTDVTLAVSLSSDSETLATGGWDSSVRLYTVPKSGAVGVSPRKTMGGHSGWVNALSFHPSEPRVLVSASADTTCRLWDAATATGLRALASHSAPVLCCRVGEAHLMASGSIDMAVHLHDLRSPDAKVDALLGHRGPVTALQFLRGDRYLLSVSGDKTARLWDLRQGRLVVGFPMPAKALSVAADPEGAVFMAGIIKSAHAPLHLFHLPEMYLK